MEKNIDLKQMNIVHINIESPFMDNSGYQETLLAKCHKLLCNNVTIINNNHVLGDDDDISRCEAKEYYNDEGVKIIRMKLYDKRDRRRIDVNGLYRILVKEKPDFIMIHGVFSFDILGVAKYVKKVNSRCIVIADSHATSDNANIMRNNPKNILFRTLLIHFNKFMSHYYKKIYAVDENAVNIMVKYSGIPRDKTAILSLGYDETLIDFDHQKEIRKSVREKYNIPEDVFLVVHGGKLSRGKETARLISIMDSFPENVHVVVFGNFKDEDYKEEVYEIAKKIGRRIHFVGVLTQKEIYDLYLASNGAVFPGTASCLRQQAVATGLPIVVGFNKADVGINIGMNGNAIELAENWTESNLREAVSEICFNPDYRTRALELCTGEYKQFSYMYQAKMLIMDNL